MHVDYPQELFAAAPNLPPCGNNTKAARTWVDIYDSRGKRLNGFCALGKPDDLGKLKCLSKGHVHGESAGEIVTRLFLEQCGDLSPLSPTAA